MYIVQSYESLKGTKSLSNDLQQTSSTQKSLLPDNDVSS